MPTPFRFDRVWDFPVPPEELWDILAQPSDYPNWWTWLRRCEADGLYEGVHARCVVQAPLPYVLSFTISVTRLVEARLVDTEVSGDLLGPARLELTPAGSGSQARLAWSLQLRDPVLRQIARFTRPAMLWAHDRVVAIGVDQFRERALQIPAE